MSEPNLVEQLEKPAAQATCIWKIIQEGEENFVYSFLENSTYKKLLSQLNALEQADLDTKQTIGQIQKN